MNENQQTENVLKAELEPIEEEGKNEQSARQEDHTIDEEQADGRLAWQYEKSAAKQPINLPTDEVQDFWGNDEPEVPLNQVKGDGPEFGQSPGDQSEHSIVNKTSARGKSRDVRSRPMKNRTGNGKDNQPGMPPKPRRGKGSQPRKQVQNVNNSNFWDEAGSQQDSHKRLSQLSQMNDSESNQTFDQINQKIRMQKRDLYDQHLSNMNVLDQMPANQAQLLMGNQQRIPTGKKKLPKID